MNNRMLTENLIVLFEKWLHKNERSNSTIEKYIHDVRHFQNYVNEEEVSKEKVLEYKIDLSRQYALTSANSMLAALNTFFKFVSWQECSVKQFKIQKKIYLPEEKELTKNEYICLAKAAEKKQNERLAMILQTICGSGIRVSELKYITVEAATAGKVEVSCKGKMRVVFLVKELRRKLLRYAKRHQIKSGIIFVTKTGKPIDRSNLWRDMKALCKQAGVSPEKVFPHNLRHLFARVFYGIEKDIAKLADILGHSSINTTRIYLLTSGAEHLHKMERMHLII